MPEFTAGVLCCAVDACVLLDMSPGSEVEDFQQIPHVTEISFTETANTSKLVTSSTAGREKSVCGTISQTGTLSIACHDGVGPIFCVNNLYRIQWSIDCNANWYDALIRITSKPVQMQISSSAPTIYSYNFDIDTFYDQPSCQDAELSG